MESTSAPDSSEIAAIAGQLRGRLDTLVVCLSHSWGGLEQVAANDAVDLASLGLKVRVLVLEGSPIHESLAHNELLGVVPLAFRPRNHFDFRMRNELNRLLGEGVNLIHAHQPSLLGSIVPWIWRRPRVVAIASRHIMNRAGKRDPYHRLIYSRLDALVVMSRTLKRNVLETHAIRERQVRVINLGLDFERFDPDRIDPGPQREKWGADAETIVVGLVGRIDPAKGQATFIKAAAGLMKSLRVGEKLKFVIVGEETLGAAGSHLEELKKMVVQFRLENHVVFAGYQEDIPDVMRAFDLFVMPSRQETFGLVAIEAMAMECPIVISNSGSAEEIVRNDQGEAFGLTMRPDDAFDLQRQLRYLLDNPLERIRMGQKAREHVKANYDRRTRILRTLQLYERSLRARLGL